MDDTIFIAELYSCGLLPGDSKAVIESKSTSVAKASYFLDHVIHRGVEFDFDILGKLFRLLTEYDHVLSKWIKSIIPNNLIVDNEIG